MQKEFQYIVSLAQQYQPYADEPDRLFEAINAFEKTTLQTIYNEYTRENASFG